MQQYTQPISYGITSYKLKQWMSVAFVQDSIRVTDDLTVDAGLRYDRQTLTDATKDFAPRFGFGWHPNGDSELAVRGGYAMYYTQIRSNAIAGALTGGLDGLTTYTATPGQSGFPTCLTGPCLPVQFDPHTLPLSQQPARNITIRAGERDFYTQQFAQYGLNFNLLPNYPDTFVNPRSQVVSIGAEREFLRGCSRAPTTSTSTGPTSIAASTSTRRRRSTAPHRARRGPSRQPTQPGRSCRSTAACGRSTC